MEAKIENSKNARVVTMFVAMYRNEIDPGFFILGTTYKTRDEAEAVAKDIEGFIRVISITRSI